jgi:hypothetical protein
MPEESLWTTFFIPEEVLHALGLPTAGDVVDFGCGQGTFTIPAANITSGTVHALVAGERSKHIARQLGIGEKTVAKDRATVLEKMRVDSVVELVCLFADTNPTHGIEHASVAQCN